MLVVRNAQFQALRKDLLRGLEERLMEHARRYFPEVCSSLDQELPLAIEHSLDRARAYGFDGEREICKYLNLQFRFGREFDRDPACSWAHGLLASSLPSPAKMDRLYALALEREPEADGYFALLGGNLG